MATRPAAKKPAAAPAPAAVPAPAPEPKKKSKLVMILSVLLLAGGGAGGGWFYMQKHNAEASQAAPQPPKPKPAVFLPLEQFTVNLTTTTQDRFLQTAITLELAGNDTSEEVKKLMPVVRGRLLLLLTGKTADDLLTIEGKQKLMGEVLAEVRGLMPANQPATPTKGVEKVHFASFVIQ